MNEFDNNGYGFFVDIESNVVYCNIITKNDYELNIDDDTNSKNKTTYEYLNTNIITRMHLIEKHILLLHICYFISFSVFWIYLYSV